MNWSFVLEGQPPSLNDLYTIGWRRDKKGRRYKGIVKGDDARQYHADAVPQIRVKCPSRWAPVGLVRLKIRLYLVRDIDADNCLKVLSDAIETATGINDKVFMPCIELKEIGLTPRDARVEVSIEDFESPSLVPAHLIPPPQGPSSASSSASIDRPPR